MAIRYIMKNYIYIAVRDVREISLPFFEYDLYIPHFAWRFIFRNSNTINRCKETTFFAMKGTNLTDVVTIN
jgi:hypothetical protein